MSDKKWKNCNVLIGEGAAFIEDQYSARFLQEFMGSIESRASLAELVFVSFGDHPELVPIIDGLAKPGGDENRPARVSAIREMLACIGVSNGWIETQDSTKKAEASA